MAMPLSKRVAKSVARDSSVTRLAQGAPRNSAACRSHMHAPERAATGDMHMTQGTPLRGTLGRQHSRRPSPPAPLPRPLPRPWSSCPPIAAAAAERSGAWSPGQLSPAGTLNEHGGRRDPGSWYRKVGSHFFGSR